MKTYEINGTCDFSFTVTVDEPAFDKLVKNGHATAKEYDAAVSAAIKIIAQELAKTDTGIEVLEITSFGVWEEDDGFIFEFD